MWDVATAALFVALAMACMAYFHYIGVRPIVLLSRQKVTFGGVGMPTVVEFTFETWNRRKYPILIRAAVITFESLDLREGEENGWQVAKRGLSLVRELKVPANDMRVDQCRFTVNPVPAFLATASGEITIVYFDPFYQKTAKAKCPIVMSVGG